MLPPPPRSTLFPYTTLFRSQIDHVCTPDSPANPTDPGVAGTRLEEHTSELQSRFDLVCRLLLEKKKKKRTSIFHELLTFLMRCVSATITVISLDATTLYMT